jgi:hypothetical protein
MKACFFILIILLSISFSGKTQKLFETQHHILKLKDSAQRFVGKPLKELLNEIGPEIKFVSAEGQRAHNALSYMIFKFVSKEEYRKYNIVGKRPLGILVYLKEKFQWDKPRKELNKWTKEDEMFYGNFTIVALSIYGEVYEEEYNL